MAFFTQRCYPRPLTILDLLLSFCCILPLTNADTPLLIKNAPLQDPKPLLDQLQATSLVAIFRLFLQPMKSGSTRKPTNTYESVFLWQMMQFPLFYICADENCTHRAPAISRSTTLYLAIPPKKISSTHIVYDTKFSNKLTVGQVLIQLLPGVCS